MARSNKVVKPDVIQACQELEAAFIKGRAWVNTPSWVTVTNHFRAMSTCLCKLQVNPPLINTLPSNPD